MYGLYHDWMDSILNEIQIVHTCWFELKILFFAFSTCISKGVEGEEEEKSQSLQQMKEHERRR